MKYKVSHHGQKYCSWVPIQRVYPTENNTALFSALSRFDFILGLHVDKNGHSDATEEAADYKSSTLLNNPGRCSYPVLADNGGMEFTIFNCFHFFISLQFRESREQSIMTEPHFSFLIFCNNRMSTNTGYVIPTHPNNSWFNNEYAHQKAQLLYLKLYRQSFVMVVTVYFIQLIVQMLCLSSLGLCCSELEFF